MMAKTRSSAGGSAMQGGADYQNRVAAWIAVKMLAERDARPMAPIGKVIYIRAETREAVDDLLVATDQDSYGFIQAKRKVSLSPLPKSPLADVFAQCVRQLLRPAEAAKRPWSRTLDPTKDRFLLITSSDTTEDVTKDLATVLKRCADLVPNQTIADAALTNKESNALKIALGHIEREWTSETGISPTDNQKRSLLSILDVETLDVELNQSGERESIIELRANVLQDALQEHLAWKAIVDACKQKAILRSGINLARLRQLLRADNIKLLHERSYRDDITRLKTHTTDTLGLLKDNASIQLPQRAIKVPREILTSLRQIKPLRSFVIVGQPGAGKSGVLYDLAFQLGSEGHDVVCLAVDRLELLSAARLRDELGLSRPLHEVIEHWDGEKQAFLVIDAFDAARGDAAATTILDLIQQVRSNERWEVIITVRKYDLRYSPQLRKLFYDDGLATFQRRFIDPEFPGLSHIRVDNFTPNEFLVCCSQWTELEHLRSAVPAQLLELLHNPFNLHLAAELLDSGMAAFDFAKLQGQTGLLQAYWHIRVDYSPGGANREKILQQCVQLMVEQRRLRAERSKVLELSEGSALEQLLSSNVLSEWQTKPEAQPKRQLISFSHNLLFDFAAEQLYLPYEVDNFTSLVVQRPELAIVLRPSLHMRMQRLWDTDRDSFWTTVYKLCGNSSVSSLVQSVPLTVVAESARRSSDLEPISSELRKPLSQQRTGGSTAYRHLVGILISDRPENLANLGPHAGPWSRLAVDATECPTFEQIAQSLSWMESALLSSSVRTPEQQRDLGLVARRVLRFAWEAQDRNGPLVTAAMRAVCKTFESDIDASTSLLHTAIEPEHLRSYGYEELQPIVQSVTSLIESAPEFVADLYKAAFTWREPAEEETAMNPSRILGFKSNKRQDYQHSCWELDQRFHNFLEGHLKLATEVIEVVIAYHAVEEHRADKNTEPFEVDGISTGFRNDYSSIWENTYGNFGSEPVSMLHQYFRYLDQEVVSQSSSGIPRDIFEILVGRGRVAILWRRLIELALKHPSVASQLRSAAWARPLLLGYGMQRPMHLFLQSVYPTLTDQEKVLVEDAIMNLPRRMKGMIFDRETRDEYLGALEGQQLRTPRARRQQTLLRNAEALRREAPEEYRVNGGAFSPPPEVLYGLRGIDPNRPSNRELIALQVPARDFNTKYMSQVPTIEDATEILGDLEILWCSLSDAGPLLPDESLVHESFAILIHAASKIAIIKDLTNSQSLYRFTERVLLTGAAALWPEVDEEKNAQFDASGGWGSPSGRVEASEGLMALATVQKSETILVHPALHKLLNDPSAVVRTQIASAALGLYYTFPERMWSMIDHFATDESVQVRKAIVSALDQLARAHPKRALTPMASILGSMDPAQEGTSDLARLAIQYLTMYYIWRGDETAEEVIVDLASKLPGSIAAAGYMTFPLRHGMMAAPGADRTAEEARLVRERSVRIFGLLITNTSSLLKPLITARLNGQDLTNHEVKCFSDLIDLARILSRELYFAVGAFQENRYDLAPEIKTPEQPWLYYAIGTGWDLLGEVGEAQTAHSLTQSLEMFIRLDPETIFLRIGSILRASKAWGYQYEQMGFDLVLRIFTTYLAEYPDLFQGSSKCLQIMRETLELFISVGWANARRLSYRLDELFR